MQSTKITAGTKIMKAARIFRDYEGYKTHQRVIIVDRTYKHHCSVHELKGKFACKAHDSPHEDSMGVAKLTYSDFH